MAWSYRQLNDECNALAPGLIEIGIGRGARTVLMVPPGLEFFALTFALFKVGAVPVLVDPGMGVKNLGQCLAEAEPTAFIGVSKAQPRAGLPRLGQAHIQTLVTVGRRWLWGGYTLAQVRRPGRFTMPKVTAEDTAAILFTSGSTGPAKGVVYTHGIFDAQLELLRSNFRPSSRAKSICATFPLFALFDAGAGNVGDRPGNGRHPARPGRPAQNITRAVRDHGVTHMFASPALLNRVSRHAVDQKVNLPGLKRVMTGRLPYRRRPRRARRHPACGRRYLHALRWAQAFRSRASSRAKSSARPPPAPQSRGRICMGPRPPRHGRVHH